MTNCFCTDLRLALGAIAHKTAPSFILVANTSAINSKGCSQLWEILATKVNKL
ncbi:hypothetical protein [Nostoc sp. 'Peltigera malacea cyanobiont' DB3992]|uniref:hypothetical protein n=1 Tax=Nostoc sp. 'Peltigera malacea cyanobiont' DB3992 TaxID=1206980 RepID=UPI0015D4FDA0|nr:hypothetical protein [Nostoc sp. 'Peltigera malacea cyanobiont' DB3992]